MSTGIDLASLVQALPDEQLPGLLALVAARLAQPKPLPATSCGLGRMLSIGEAATRTGMSRDWLYRHAKQLPFTKRIGRKVLFDEVGLSRWLATRGR